MIYQIHNLFDMEKLAEKISVSLTKQDIICLSGDLGAGKTTLVQMIGKNLGIKETITSPTFEIVKIYKADNFYVTHLDAYRLDGKHNKEMFDEYIYNSGVIFIEWAEFLNIKKAVKTINIKVFDENQREVEINGFSF